MKQYSCGCRVANPIEYIPGVAFSLKNPNAASDAGWFEQTNTRDGEHLVNPCAKHTPGVIVRWGASRLMGAVRRKR